MSLSRNIGLLGGILSATTLAGSLSLSERSPFLPPGFEKVDMDPSVQPVEATSLLLKGVYRLGGRDYARIETTSTGESFWLEQDNAHEGIVLLAFNEYDNTCRVRLPDGRVTVLPLQDLPATTIPVPVQSFQEAASLTRNPATQAADRKVRVRPKRTPQGRVVRPDYSRLDDDAEVTANPPAGSGFPGILPESVTNGRDPDSIRPRADAEPRAIIRPRMRSIANKEE